MGVKLVIDAVCIMKEVKPKKVPGEKPVSRLMTIGSQAKLHYKNQQSFWTVYTSLIVTISLTMSSQRFSHILTILTFHLRTLPRFLKLVPLFASG